ncbi:hypothetical protein L9H26_00065 [Morganella psychrotolerans]|uniref:Uncharacterized protein n=1 Tax=Morganella psychrotolerans TaxID=368603 RepID=A0A5M9R0G2_9GAMM|nr:hypothetical protein [Morganella psychrotolerans]KAA8713592.1 hypothetical protein F4V73_16790 [Morganella psychrotolerans]
MEVKDYIPIFLFLYIIFSFFRFIYYYYQDQDSASLRESSFFNEFGYYPYHKSLAGTRGVFTHEFKDTYFNLILFFHKNKIMQRKIKKDEIEFVLSWPESYTFYLKKKTKAGFFDLIIIVIGFVILKLI